MQLIDISQTQFLTEVNLTLHNILKDIASKVEINSDFSISHPDYKPLEIPVEAVERFKKMPQQMQQKYLSLQLRSFIYGIYYNGSMQTALASDGEENCLPLNLENNTILGVDVEFYQQLHESNCGTGYFDPGWSFLREESDSTLAVTKGGLRLHIEREKHLQSEQQTAVVGDSVAIRMPKNLVQNGFYVAVGNHGLYRVDDSESQPVTVRVYFNLTPEGAVAVMNSLTQRLNELAVPNHFKVLYNPKEYKRHDSGVLYFDKRDYEVVREVLQIVYWENKRHFKTEIPLFTKQLAVGLGLAEEPDKKFASEESFGMNRCQIVANGLLEAWNQRDDSDEGRMKAITQQFSVLGIDLQHPYLNADSEDIYQLLDVNK